MSFEFLCTSRADPDLDALEADAERVKRLKAVRKALGLLENKTPAAWRIFWHCSPGKKKITILAITPHP